MARNSSYKSVLDNTVYAKCKIAIINDDKKVVLSCIILPKRYILPTEDQVIEYLQQKVKYVEDSIAWHLLGGSHVSEKTSLERAIIDLPIQLRKDLGRGEEECMKFVRSHTPAPALSDEEPSLQYMYIKYGLIPNEIIIKKRRDINNSHWYESALSQEILRENGLGERWIMRILLDEGSLPERSEIDTLLNHGTSRSQTLYISQDYYSTREVEEVMDFVYEYLPLPEQITLLPDITDNIREELALKPVIALHELVEKMEAQLGRKETIILSKFE